MAKNDEYQYSCKNKVDRKECSMCDENGKIQMPVKSNDFICPSDLVTKLTCIKIEK